MSGTKVTSDPKAQSEPILEGTGIVTSDSLAASSLNSGGDFGSTTNAAAMSVPSKSTTANTTDTSAAIELPPATDAAARRAQEPFSEKAELEAGRVPVPPTTMQVKQDGPKGTGLTEGGFDAGAPNASFGTDIGGRKDPGRVAVQEFQKTAAQQAADAGRAKDAGVSGDGQFDVLKDTPA